MRLNKFIADCGVCARRKADALIANGDIMMNNEIVTALGTQVDPDTDVVAYRGEVIRPATGFVYYMLNKPVSVVSTCDDPQGRRTVLDIIKINKRIYPVGRLDYESSGLLILTNDGELTNRVTHPSYEIDKEYIAVVRNPINDSDVDKLKSGVFIDGHKTHPADVNIIGSDEKTTQLKFIIHEGRNRQIRKMIQAIGSHVYQLERTRLGRLTLDGLKTGEYRELTKEEIIYLKGETL